MPGFDPDFADPVDYIVKITHRIWEERGIDLIRTRYYHPQALLRAPLGVSETADAVVNGTLETLAEFPDRQLLADDVIIGMKPHGFYSSHRVRSTGTHLGGGRFGAATGRAITMLTIADCLCRDNRVVEEWLVRDQAGIVRQLGHDPVAMGARIGRAHRASAAPGADALIERWRDPAGLTIEGDAALARRVVDGWTRIWTRAAIDDVRALYDRAVRLESPGGELHHGVSRLENVLFAILAAIPGGSFTAHHAIALREPDRPPRVAIRWSYRGRHAGHGRYGDPSGAELVLLGISQAELRGDRIINEWMLLDELSVHAQIAAHVG
jgi:predicted ester cyclase